MTGECKKVSYRSKRAAKTARRRVGDGGLRPYFCERHNSWHLGHLPRAIHRGDVSRSEVYGS